MNDEGLINFCFDRYSPFFDKKVQAALLSRHQRLPRGDSEALAWPITVFFAVESALNRQNWQHFASSYQVDPEFCARLLLEVTHFHERPDAQKTLEEIVLGLMANKSGGVDYRLKWRGIIQRTPNKKWDAIADTIRKCYRRRVKGDTLRTSLVPTYLKRRQQVLARWHNPIEAYFAFRANRHKNGC